MSDVSPEETTGPEASDDGTGAQVRPEGNSPYATGGGGVKFEQKVAVQYLAHLLTGDGASELVPVREYPIWTDVGSRGSWSARTEPVTDRESVADSLEMTTPETLLVV